VGRLCLILPDTLFSPEKARSRELLATSCTIERLHNLGPDWFGPAVRMGAVLLQARKGPVPMLSDYSAMLLTGETRRKAIVGDLPMPQLEAQISRRIPQERSGPANRWSFELFRTRRDDQIIRKMEEHSWRLEDVCTRGRGEEMAKSGLLWRCPSCLGLSTPGRKQKGGSYEPKPCPRCGLLIGPADAGIFNLVSDDFPPDVKTAPFVDGDDIAARYRKVRPHKKLHLDFRQWECKDPSLYESPKILLRQAGVGLLATVDYDGSYCPQSVYIYKPKPEFYEQGLRVEFVLAALLSRSMTYLVFKRFGEVDPARAHAKVTHARLADMPIPKVDFSLPEQSRAHGRAVDLVRLLLKEKETNGSPADLEIEQLLRGLWGLTAEEGWYINGEFADLPAGQVVRDLFPDGVPGRPQTDQS